MASKTFNDTGMGRIIAWISARVFKKSESVTTQTLGIDTAPANNSSNLVTSGGVYNAIAASDKVFVAEYGVTTYNAIMSAINAGKTVYCKYEYNTGTYIYMPLSYSDDSEVDFTTISGITVQNAYVSSEDSWDYIENVLERISNKVISLSSASTNTQYPSAKLVYDQLATKQATLVSGTNIKTINNNDLLGSGNVSIATPGTLVSNNTTAQTASASEALSGTINLHKIAKTGTYSDLIGTPTIPTVSVGLSNDGTLIAKSPGTSATGVASIDGNDGATYALGSANYSNQDYVLVTVDSNGDTSDIKTLKVPNTLIVEATTANYPCIIALKDKNGNVLQINKATSDASLARNYYPISGNPDSAIILDSANYSSYTPILNSASTHTTNSSVIYAPITSGTANDLLTSGGSNTAPSWVGRSSVNVGSANRLTNRYVATSDSTLKCDLNTDLVNGGQAYNVYSSNRWVNGPTGLGLGKVIEFGNSSAHSRLCGQLAWDVNTSSSTDTTKNLFWRAADGVGDTPFTNSQWHQIAYKDYVDDLVGDIETLLAAI